MYLRFLLLQLFLCFIIIRSKYLKGRTRMFCYHVSLVRVSCLEFHQTLWTLKRLLACVSTLVLLIISKKKAKHHDSITTTLNIHLRVFFTKSYSSCYTIWYTLSHNSSVLITYFKSWFPNISVMVRTRKPKSHRYLPWIQTSEKHIKTPQNSSHMNLWYDKS